MRRVEFWSRKFPVGYPILIAPFILEKSNGPMVRKRIQPVRLAGLNESESDKNTNCQIEQIVKSIKYQI